MQFRLGGTLIACVLLIDTLVSVVLMFGTRPLVLSRIVTGLSLCEDRTLLLLVLCMAQRKAMMCVVDLATVTVWRREVDDHDCLIGVVLGGVGLLGTVVGSFGDVTRVLVGMASGLSVCISALIRCAVERRR